MKKVFFALVALIGLMCYQAQAQNIVDDYSFSTIVDSTAWIAGVDSTIIASPAGTVISTRSDRIDIGFTFNLGGSTFSQFSTNVNGTIRLGSTWIRADWAFAQPLGYNCYAGRVEPFGWRGQFDSTCYTRYATVGDSGSRVTVVETRMGVYGQDSTHITFQVQMFEATGSIRFVYGPIEGPLPQMTRQCGVARTTSDIIFIEQENHEAFRFGTSCTLTTAAGVWPETWRCYTLEPDASPCPYPGDITVVSNNPDSTVLSWPAVAGAGFYLTIANADIDASLYDTSICIMGMLNGTTTYSGTLQTMCSDGSESYRMREFSFTTANGPVNSMPWTADFDNATAAANWNIALRADQISNWERRTASGNGYMYSGAIDNPAYTADAWLISPSIQLPADANVPLMWDYRSLQSTNRYDTPVIDVMVAVCDTTDAIDTSAAAWTKLMTLEGLVSNYKTYCLSLEGYSGNRVRVAFARHGFCFGTAYIDNVRIGTADTLARIYAPQHPMVDESTELRAFYVGVDTIATPFFWNSSKYDNNEATMTARSDSRVVDIVYATSGLDTITLQYGTRTDTLVVLVKDCATASTYPWRDDFENGTDCWTLPSDNRWYLHRYPNCAYDGSCYMRSKTNPATAHNRLLSNTFVMPSAADITNLSLIFQTRNTYNNTDAHLSVYFALDSNNAETLLIDTVIGWNTYRQITVPLSNLAGQTGHFVFEHWMSSTSITHDIYLDNVEVRFFNDTLPDSTLCDTIRLFPWQADFSGDMNCWNYESSRNSWNFTSGYAVLGSEIDGITGTLTTPPIALPADSTLSLRWTVNGYADYEMRIITADSTHILLLRDTLQETATTQHYDLGSYRGQTVRFSIYKHPTSFIFPSGIYVNNLEVLPLYPPVASLSSPNNVFADGVLAMVNATIQQGLDSNINYYWTSSMAISGNATIVSTLGSSMTIAYGGIGTDTVTLVATNDYGADTVTRIIGVNPADPLIPPCIVDNFNGNLNHWYQDATCSWQEMLGSGRSRWYDPVVNTRIVSRPIEVPSWADDSLVLEWKVCSESRNTAQRYYVLATTGDYTDYSQFDTIFTFDSVLNTAQQSWTTGRVGLAAYAGQTIHIAFVNHPTATFYQYDARALRLDDVQVVDLRSPQVRIVKPSVAHSDEPSLVRAELIEGSHVGESYNWHSSMATAGLATMTAVADSLHLFYTAVGTDTITVIVNTLHGTDTAIATLNVQSCAVIDTLPWVDQFYTSGLGCWRAYNFTSVTNSIWRNDQWGMHSYGINLTSWDNMTANNWLISPAIQLPDSLNDATLRYRLRAPWLNRDGLIYTAHLDVLVSTGDATDTSTYSHVLFCDNLYISSNSDDSRLYKFDLDSFAGQRIHIAFVHRGPYDGGIYLDSVSIREGRQPEVQIIPPTTAHVGEPCRYVAILTDGTRNGLTYTWHSSLLDTTFVASDTIYITYPIAGYDVVSVTATNAFGSDMDGVYVDVLDPAVPDTIYRTLTIDVNDATMGTVSGAGVYPDSSVVTLSANPFEGYHFVVWNDNDTHIVRTLTLVSDTAFSAYFAVDTLPTPPPDTVWRTVTVTTNATDVAEPYGSGVYADSSTVEIGYHLADTSTVGGHWQFLGWNDGGTDNPRDILVTSDTAIVALFEWVVDSTEGINELSIFNSQFSIYPNPASKTVTVETDQPSTLTLTDATGSECGQWKVENGKTTLDISPLPAGVYFVRLSTSPTIRKLIIR